MPETFDRTVEDRLVALAVRLDEASPPLTAAEVRTRRVVQPMPHRRNPLLGAAGAALAVAAAVAGFVLIMQQDDPSDVRTADRPATETPPPPPPPTATTAPAVPAPGFLPFKPGDSDTPLLLVWNNTDVAVIDYTGRELARSPQGGWYANNADRGVDLVPDGDGVRPVEAITIDDPVPGCHAVHGRGGIVAAACGATPESADEIRVVSADGKARPVTGARPGVGHWRYGLPSPDGKWVLAQWSGECEFPAAFLINVASGRVDDVAPAGVNSYGIGWAPDGRAVVGIESGACGASTSETGTFLVDPNKKVRTRIHPFFSGAMVQWAHPNSSNRLERRVDRALQELGLKGCCGEPSYGKETNQAGMVFEGADIMIYAVPRSESLDPARSYEVRFRCGNDIYTLSEFDSTRPDRTRLERAADRLASRLYCTRQPA